MKKVCKIRCYPNKTQIKEIYHILGCCRFVMNHYIELQNKRYENNEPFLSGYDFSKYLNKRKKDDPDFYFLHGVSSKALKDAIMTQEKAYKNFFRKIKNGEKCRRPWFKSRKKMNHESFYFIKDNIHFDTGKKNVIKIPILGNIRITERNYLPDKRHVTSGRVIREYDKFYLSFIYDIPDDIPYYHHDFGIGIDVGIKSYCTISFSTDEIEPRTLPNFIKSDVYKKKEERYKSLLRIISKKAEINYYRLVNHWMDKHPGEIPSEKIKNIMKGESYNSTRIRKLRIKANNAYRSLVNYRNDQLNKYAYLLTARIKPSYITMENLRVSEMISNDNDSTHTLHKYIQDSGFYMFGVKMKNKCYEYGIELRLANKYFASSKKCSRCGNKLKNLTLSDRVYRCPVCGLSIDRDLNASINLVYLDKYVIA